MQHIDLEQFANGEFSAQVNREIEKVSENIMDPNTDSATVRKITITIAFKANQSRDFVTTGVQVKSSLAPALGAVTALGMEKDINTGRVEVAEIGKQIKGQMSISDIDNGSESGTAIVEGKEVDMDLSSSLVLSLSRIIISR